jgi:hypothetical protein
MDQIINKKQARRKMKKNAQQEIVGFVLIVVIIIIVGVVFLGIHFRKSPDSINILDAELNNFLISSSRYTSDCVLKEPFYADLTELVKGCYSNSVCSDSRQACNVMNQTYNNILRAPNPLKAGEGRPISSNQISFYYQENLEDPNTKNEFYNIFLGDNVNGSCSLKKTGRYVRYSYPGNIVIEFEICKS